MQMGFDFGAAAELAAVRDRLRDVFGAIAETPGSDPIAQLVRSLISSRTRDEVSLRAYRRLRHRFPAWPALAEAPPVWIEATIAEVTFAEAKAHWLGPALRRIEAERGAFSLDFLADRPLDAALIWLERLPGVGRKVAAATLNFSRLQRPAFVVDSHVLRILRRFGFVAPRAETPAAYAAVMAASEGWSAAALFELHVLLKRLGQTVCRDPRALCGRCPLAAGCATGGKVLARLDQGVSPHKTLAAPRIDGRGRAPYP